MRGGGPGGGGTEVKVEVPVESVVVVVVVVVGKKERGVSLCSVVASGNTVVERRSLHPSGSAL